MADKLYKVQIDAAGRKALAYTEGHNDMIEVDDPEHVKTMMSLLHLGPMTKTYVLAERRDDGMFAISAQLDESEYPAW